MIISRTPLRISLFGGGTDFPAYYREHGGLCLTAAIDKYVYVILKPRTDDKIRVSYTKTEEVSCIDDLQHDLIRECLRLKGVTQGIEIHTIADIPGYGSGLGSSSAVVVGTLNVLDHFLYYERLDDGGLAKQAIEVECDIVRNTPGHQDQVAVTFGGFRELNFIADFKRPLPNTSLAFSPIMLKTLKPRLMLFSTGIARSGRPILDKLNSELDVEALHAIKKYAEAATDAIKREEFDTVGYLLDGYWLLKKSMADGISNPIIDAMYKLARQAGALGGKICGAGGGGYLLLYVPLEKQEDVRQALSGYQELRFRFEARGTLCKRLF